MWSLVLFFVVLLLFCQRFLSGRFFVVAYFSMMWMSAAFFLFLNIFLKELFVCDCQQVFFLNVFYLICNRPFELLLDLSQLKTVLPSVGRISF